jgi:hypothetical protein
LLDGPALPDGGVSSRFGEAPVTDVRHHDVGQHQVTHALPASQVDRTSPAFSASCWMTQQPHASSGRQRLLGNPHDPTQIEFLDITASGD